MAVTAPVLSTLPSPALPTDEEATFDAKAGASLTAQANMVVEVNASLQWMATQVNSTESYSLAATNAAIAAGASANSASQSMTAAQAAAVAAGSSAGLPSLAGNARRPLTVLPNEQGASWQTQIKALYIEPLLKANSSGALALNVGTSGFFNLTLTANSTITFTNLPALSSSEAILVVVRINQGSTAYSVTFPAGVIWISSGKSSPPPPNANNSQEYTFTFEGAEIFGRRGSGT